MAQLNDLLVTGNSRFLNEINGKIDWLNINNKPTIIGTVTQVKVGSTTYDPTSGVISLPAYPSVPVTSVAGKTGAVTLTASDVGALASTTKYAGASTAGGSATSAVKLDTSTAGSATQPCYFASGKPSACTYSLNKTVPSDAVFTDTKVTSVDNHYTPTAASASKITITSTGGYPKKIEISRDSKGHVTGATVTETEVIPDNDFNVTQTATDSTNANYELLFSSTADNTTRTEGARKTQYFTYNPSSKAITIGTRGTNVVGDYSFAIGSNVDAKATSTFAVGNYAIAEGTYSTAFGSNTNARYRSQFVFGEYNIHDSKSEATIPTDRGNYVEIVGNGTSTTASNARTLDWDGNEWLAGKLEASYFVAASTYTGGEAECRITPNFVRVVERITEGSSTTGVTTELQSDDVYSSSTWDGTNQYLKSALADKVNKSQLVHMNSSGWVGINSIRCGTMISNFTNGTATVAFTSLGLTTRPEVMLLTCQSQKLAMEYDFDSSATAITLKLVGSTMSGNIRYSWMIAVKGN